MDQQFSRGKICKSDQFTIRTLSDSTSDIYQPPSNNFIGLGTSNESARMNKDYISYARNGSSLLSLDSSPFHQRQIALSTISLLCRETVRILSCPSVDALSPNRKCSFQVRLLKQDDLSRRTNRVSILESSLYDGRASNHPLIQR